MKASSARITQSEVLPLKSDLGALANRINKRTQTAHNSINKLMVLKFSLALRDAKIYRQGIQMYYHVFKSIEKSLQREMARDTQYAEILKAIYRPAILRTERLHQDLMFFYGDEKKFATPILEKQIEFCEHIEKVTQEKPYLLLAYMHVLYLALFAGGKIFSSKLAQTLGMFPHVEGKTAEEVMLGATTFFKFDVEDDESLRIEYKRDYELATRNSLTEHEKQEIIEESQYVFVTNSECVKEIETHNLKRLQGKLAYQVATKGYYVMWVLAVLCMMYYVRSFI
ncbi:unnamed protein product [Kuraishia capsulata CBS 1993]|uniref:Heme oxygenase n=1 Tax=Kuraishia capsulata CBS 1993 TaxID=1382522 RepID=W6MFE1_9ASCO|nr:uncharacterized protein KUCA_T00000457001 [Kuraishia capsulata CBS 1993]CDK24494.1 unnamed protein product [Kuraishia capsulata CBS 1993]